MFRRRVHVLALIGSLVPLTTRAQSPALPETPVGAVLREWLDAFASGDTIRIRNFYRRYQPDRIPQGSVNSRLGSAGFELVSVEKARRVTSSSSRERRGLSVWHTG